MSETTTEAGTLEAPLVWVGCLGCYAGGVLRGQWMEAADLAELSGRCDRCGAEEREVFDAEAGEGAAAEVLTRALGASVVAWSGYVEQVAEEAPDYDALERALLYWDHVHGGRLQLAEALEAAEDAYCCTLRGYGSTEEQLGEHFIEEGLLEVPEHLTAYIDTEQYGRDLLMGDLFAVEDGRGFVEVFWHH